MFICCKGYKNKYFLLTMKLITETIQKDDNPPSGKKITFSEDVLSQSGKKRSFDEITTDDLLIQAENGKLRKLNNDDKIAISPEMLNTVIGFFRDERDKKKKFRKAKKSPEKPDDNIQLKSILKK